MVGDFLSEMNSIVRTRPVVLLCALALGLRVTQKPVPSLFVALWTCIGVYWFWYQPPKTDHRSRTGYSVS